MTDFRNNHYVPRWYQSRFLPVVGGKREFHYMDLRPQTVTQEGHSHTQRAIRRLGPKKCFRELDLYTWEGGGVHATDIERSFFGKFDRSAPEAVEYFESFSHPSVNTAAFDNLLTYMSLQKLRTPKGLGFIAEVARITLKNDLLLLIQQFRNLFCTTWAESVWSIADASQSPTKFIVSDHPVTVYNYGLFPGAHECRGFGDPDVRMTGTHTLFPLGPDKILILTNLSWARNPYTSPLLLRPNPKLLRNTVFNFLQIQVGRQLSETEVCEINYVIKQRAYRFIAAAQREWLFPERSIPHERWDRLGGGYLFMPDPRSMTFTSEMMFGFEDGRTSSIDEYGRVPGQKGYGEMGKTEWDAHLGFQGEFARVFGPKRRGTTYEFGKATDEDDPDFHKYHLRLEATHKPKNPVTSRGSRKRKKR